MAGAPALYPPGKLFRNKKERLAAWRAPFFSESTTAASSKAVIRVRVGRGRGDHRGRPVEEAHRVAVLAERSDMRVPSKPCMEQGSPIRSSIQPRVVLDKPSSYRAPQGVPNNRPNTVRHLVHSLRIALRLMHTVKRNFDIVPHIAPRVCAANVHRVTMNYNAARVCVRRRESFGISRGFFVGGDSDFLAGEALCLQTLVEEVLKRRF